MQSILMYIDGNLITGGGGGREGLDRGSSCDRGIQVEKKAACAVGLRLSVLVTLYDHWNGVTR